MENTYKIINTITFHTYFIGEYEDCVKQLEKIFGTAEKFDKIGYLYDLINFETGRCSSFVLWRDK